MPNDDFPYTSLDDWIQRAERDHPYDHDDGVIAWHIKKQKAVIAHFLRMFEIPWRQIE